MRVLVALGWLAVASSPALQDVEDGSLAALDRRRDALEERFGGDDLEDEGERIRALAHALEGLDAPPWYRREVAALQQRHRALLALPTETRARLAAARARARAGELGAADAFAEVLGPRHEEVAWALRSAALACVEDRPADAERAARRAHALVAPLSEERPATVARHRMWLGEALVQLALHEEAREHLAGCRATWERLGSAELGVYELDALHTTGALARALDGTGAHEEAGELHAEVVLGTRRLHGEASREYAAALNNLAAHRNARGDLAGALPLLHESLACKLALLEDGHPSLGVAWLNLATCLWNAGEGARATDAFAEALRVFDALPAAAALAVLARLSLVEVLLVRDDLDAADEVVAAALAGSAALDLPPLRAKALGTAGAIRVAQGELDEAERLFTEAAELSREHFGPTHPEAARALLGLAFVAEARGELEAAAELYGRILAVDPDAPSHVRYGLGRVRLRSGELAAAENVLALASEGWERERAGAPAGPARWEAPYGSPLPRLALVRVLRGDAEGAWEAVERWRGRALLELATAAREADDPAALPRLRNEAQELEQRLSTLRAAEGAADARVRAGARATLARLAAVRAELARAAATEALAPFPLARVRATLAADEALVGWLEGADPGGGGLLLTYVLRRDGPVRWFRRPAPDGGIRSRLDALRDELAAEARSPFPSPRARGDETAALRDALLGAAEAGGALDGVRHLVVVPSDDVELLPLDALVGDRWTSSFAPSASLHAWLRERGDRGDAAASVLVVGAPALGGGGAPPSPRVAGLAPLPRARDEVAAVRDAFPRGHVLVGEDATEGALDALASSGRLAAFHTVHLATHALVDDVRPGRSAVVLSQRDLADPLEAAIRGEPIADGLLTADEVLARWRLDAELVTLSGCRTALGRPSATEGHLGLATAFLRAGARSLLVTLWEVDDEVAMRFMRSYYRHWRGGGDAGARTKAEALRRAREDLRSFSPDGETRPYAHPSAWAAFVLVGAPD